MLVAVALSGGVDSAVCASLLAEAGHRVSAWHMLLPLPNVETGVRQAERMAAALGVPLHLFDLRPQFSERVIRYFCESYRAGLTPNPCVRCNREIKFGLLAEAMRASGAEAIATGHYARIVPYRGQPHVARAVDPAKDQSYFLARLEAAQLRNMLWPLGEWRKSEVMARGRELGLPLPEGESQDVCFLGEGLSAFLTAQGFADQPGDMVDGSGKILGRHQGLWRYTVGQRRGLNLPDATPWYVAALDTGNNRLILGKEPELLQSACFVRDLRWTGGSPPESSSASEIWRGLVRIRSRHEGAIAELRPTGRDTAVLRFDAPQRAVTPGQFAVLYQDDVVIGCGVITQNDATFS